MSIYFISASKFGFSLFTYSLFGNYFNYSHVATFYKLSMKSGLFSQASTCLLFKLNLIDLQGLVPRGYKYNEWSRLNS